MSGGLIALALILVYLAHTYFLWKRAQTSKPAFQQDQEELHDTCAGQGDITNARLSHFAQSLGRQHMPL